MTIVTQPPFSLPRDRINKLRSIVVLYLVSAYRVIRIKKCKGTDRYTERGETVHQLVVMKGGRVDSIIRSQQTINLILIKIRFYSIPPHACPAIEDMSEYV